MIRRVEFESDVQLQMASQIASGLLTRSDIAALKKWTVDIEENGLEIAQSRRGYHDHALEGEWRGHRAIAFSAAGRLIYRIENDRLVIVVVRVTATHNYRRK